MTFLILLAVVAVAVVFWIGEMEAFKNAIHQDTETRDNKLVQYLAYHDQYWGMILGNAIDFPLYKKKLDVYIKRVRVATGIVLTLFLVLFVYTIVFLGFYQA